MVDSSREVSIDCVGEAQMEEEDPLGNTLCWLHTKGSLDNDMTAEQLQVIDWAAEHQSIPGTLLGGSGCRWHESFTKSCSFLMSPKTRSCVPVAFMLHAFTPTDGCNSHMRILMTLAVDNISLLQIIWELSTLLMVVRA